MKPIIKWVGGKRRFLTHIQNEIKPIAEYNNYFEPFAGSAAVMFHLEPENKIYINDFNKSLINFYKAVKEDWSKVVERTRDLVDENKSTDDYYVVRKKYNEMILKEKLEIDFEEASTFLYLNKVGFNGMYRVNSKGEFNIPKGSYKEPYIPSNEEMISASKILKRTTILQGEWFNAITDAGEGDLIYLDPPYYPDDSSKFLGYTNPRFDEECHRKMVEESKAKVDLGATVLISNSASVDFEEIVKEYFGEGGYKRIDIPTRRTINPNVVDKDKFIETLYVLGGKNE